MDLSTIRGAVKRRLGEPSASDSGYWEDSDYTAEVNRGAEQFAMETNCLKSYVDIETEDFNDTNGNLFDISEDSLDDFKAVTEVHYYIGQDADDSTLGSYTPLKKVSRKEMPYKQSENDNVTGVPSFYCYEDRIIELDVIPNDGDLIRIWYYRVPSADEGEAVSADADIPIIPEKYHEALVYWVCWKFSEGDELRSDRVAYYRDMWRAEIAKAKVTEAGSASGYGRIRRVY